jgi:hypothetical protein
MFLIVTRLRALTREPHSASSYVPYSVLLVCSCRISGTELHSAENREGFSAKVGQGVALGTKGTWQDTTAAQAPPCADSGGPL